MHQIQTRPDGQFSLDDIELPEGEGGHVSPLLPIPDGFWGGMTLGAARDELTARLEAGQTCPCCSKPSRIYRRKVNVQMVRTLIELYRRHGMEFAYLPPIRRAVGADNREESKLAYWGLIEEEATRREDGGRAGYWRVTSAGESFVLGHATIPKYARIYGRRLLGVYGDPVTIRDALGTAFNYSDLMAGV